MEGKDYNVERASVMLPPTIKQGDSVKAIVVKGEIRHVEFDKAKMIEQTKPTKTMITSKKQVTLDFECYAVSKDESHKQKVFILSNN